MYISKNTPEHFPVISETIKKKQSHWSSWTMEIVWLTGSYCQKTVPKCSHWRLLTFHMETSHTYLSTFVSENSILQWYAGGKIKNQSDWRTVLFDTTWPNIYIGTAQNPGGEMGSGVMMSPCLLFEITSRTFMAFQWWSSNSLDKEMEILSYDLPVSKINIVTFQSRDEVI